MSALPRFRLPDPAGPGYDRAVQDCIDRTTGLVHLKLHANWADCRAASVEAVFRVLVKGKVPKRPDCLLDTWLCRIAVNVERDRRRRNWRFEPSDPLILESRTPGKDRPDRDWQVKRDGESLARALARLTTLHRDCWLALVRDERKAAEVAREKGLKVHQVRNAARKAGLKLRAFLAEEGMDGYTDAA